MDAHSLFMKGAASSAASLAGTRSTAPAMSSRLFVSVESCIGDSPNSTHLDTEACTRASASQDHLSSTLGISPSGKSSLESNSCFQSSSSFDGSSSGRPCWSKNEDDPWNTNYEIQELETVPVGSKGEVKKESPRHASSSQMNPTYWGSLADWPLCRHSDECGIVVGEELLVYSVPPENLKKLLIACAKSLSENNTEEFDKMVEKARSVVSITGEPIERLGAYMVESLVARKEVSGLNIYRGLRCREPESKDLLLYMHILHEICPYLKFSYMAANGAIADACRTEERIHIVDFKIAQGMQWMALLQALAARPGGPPHVRITGIDDPVSNYARGAGLEVVGRRLAVVSEKFRIPVEFESVPVFVPDVTVEMLGIRTGEALMVNFPLKLHHTPDESVDVSNPRDGLLRLIKSFSPKLVTLVEQESNTNTTPFLTRFVETLDFYLAIFESIDWTIPRNQKERINVEQQCLARDIVNIIACEGKERVERHELLGKWRSRFAMAGFRQYPLSAHVNSVIRSLLGCYSPHYTLMEKDGAMLLGWKGRFLVSASAWQ